MPPGRDRESTDVESAILDALLNGPESGMTVFEIRSRVDHDIEALEPALANLREEGMITVDVGENRSVIRPSEQARNEAEARERSRDWRAWLRRLLRQ